MASPCTSSAPPALVTALSTAFWSRSRDRLQHKPCRSRQPLSLEISRPSQLFCSGPRAAGMRSCGPHEADLPKGLGRSHGGTADDPQQSCLYVPQVLCYVKALLKYNLHQEAKLSCSFWLLGTGAGLEKKAHGRNEEKRGGPALTFRGQRSFPGYSQVRDKWEDKAWGKMEGASRPL